MFELSRCFRIYPLAIATILLFQVGSKMALSQVSQQAESSGIGRSVSLVIWTDHGRYSLGESLKLNASLQNAGDTPVYLDRRMFWTGLGGGLKLEISDEHGNPVPARLLSDATMPPPKEEDMSILIRLDEGFFYGTSVNLLVKDFFPKPGRYSIRVTYKSWLRKEFVPPPLRDLPVIWADAPQTVSEPVLIDVTQ